MWVADSPQEPRVVNLVRQGGRDALNFPARTKRPAAAAPAPRRPIGARDIWLNSKSIVREFTIDRVALGGKAVSGALALSRQPA